MNYIPKTLAFYTLTLGLIFSILLLRCGNKKSSDPSPPNRGVVVSVDNTALAGDNDRFTLTLTNHTGETIPIDTLNNYRVEITLTGRNSEEIMGNDLISDCIKNSLDGPHSALQKVKIPTDQLIPEDQTTTTSFSINELEGRLNNAPLYNATGLLDKETIYIPFTIESIPFIGNRTLTVTLQVKDPEDNDIGQLQKVTYQVVDDTPKELVVRVSDTILTVYRNQFMLILTNRTGKAISKCKLDNYQMEITLTGKVIKDSSDIIYTLPAHISSYLDSDDSYETILELPENSTSADQMADTTQSFKLLDLTENLNHTTELADKKVVGISFRLLAAIVNQDRTLTATLQVKDDQGNNIGQLQTVIYRAGMEEDGDDEPKNDDSGIN